MQVRRECSQSAGKSSQLLHVILRIQVAGDGDDTSAMRDGSAQQFRRDASTDRGINRDRGKSRAPGRIAGNANDRYLALGQFPQKGIDARLIAGRENKAVVIFLQIGFNRFDIAFAEPRIGTKIQLDRDTKRAGGGRQNSFPERIEKRGDLFRQVHDKPQSLVQLQAARRKVRLVAKLLRHL